MSFVFEIGQIIGLPSPSELTGGAPKILRWRLSPGGAGSEVWNRVYMIAPVKKPRDLVQIFLENKYGRECWHGRTRSFCSVLSFPAYKYQEKVSMNFFNGLFGHPEVWCMNSSWVTSLIVWFGISASSVIFKLREFSSDHLALFLIFFHLQWL